jgi:hypothetical protein
MVSEIKTIKVLNSETEAASNSNNSNSKIIIETVFKRDDYLLL